MLFNLPGIKTSGKREKHSLFTVAGAAPESQQGKNPATNRIPFSFLLETDAQYFMQLQVLVN